MVMNYREQSGKHPREPAPPLIIGASAVALVVLLHVSARSEAAVFSLFELSVLANFILPILLVALVASYCTTVLCRLAQLRHKKITWLFGLPGIFGAASVSFCFMVLGLSLGPGRNPYPGDFLKWVLMLSVGGSLLGFFPSQAVVWFYRRKTAQRGPVR
jgi:hypothetical protein